MEISIKVPAIEKLIDYTLSAVGNLAAPLVAIREGKARLIEAKYKARILQIEAEAQAKVREALLPEGEDHSGNVEISDAIVQHLSYQTTKKLGKLHGGFARAARLLEGKEVPDAPVDHDFAARVFQGLQDVSSEEMQDWWVRILAGNIERPNSVSIRTLSVLRDLDQATAELFRRLCSCCIAIKYDTGDYMDVRVCSLGGRASQNSLMSYGLGFEQLNRLNEYGLIIPDYNSVHGYEFAATGVHLDDGIHAWRTPIRFQNRFWYLIHKEGANTAAEIDVRGIALTIAGRELSEVVELLTMPEYQEALNVYFRGMGLTMTETGDETGIHFKIQD